MLFILLGVVLLLFTTGSADWATVWTVAIPVIFVLLGAWALVVSRFRNLTGSVLVIVIAGTVLLQTLASLPPGFVGRWWPLGFVLLGLLIFVRRERRHHVRTEYVDGSEAGILVSIFGGIEVTE